MKTVATVLLLLISTPTLAMVNGPPGRDGRANHAEQGRVDRGGQCNGCGTRMSGFTIESGRWSGTIGIFDSGITYEGSRVTRSYENPQFGLSARGERCLCSQRDRDRANFGRDGGSDRDHSGD